jgi:hypothetical protein
MATTRPFHVGVLVADLEQAMRKFEAVLGIHFRRPRQMRFLREMAGTATEERTARATYSVEGPPYIELMQADGTDAEGLTGLGGGERLHHLGVWVPDTVGHRAALTSANLVEAEAAFASPDGQLRAWMCRPSSFYGLRVEFTDASLEADYIWFQEDPPAA